VAVVRTDLIEDLTTADTPQPLGYGEPAVRTVARHSDGLRTTRTARMGGSAVHALQDLLFWARTDYYQQPIRVREQNEHPTDFRRPAVVSIPGPAGLP
jgi:hypothetical protein